MRDPAQPGKAIRVDRMDQQDADTLRQARHLFAPQQVDLRARPTKPLDPVRP